MIQIFSAIILSWVVFSVNSAVTYDVNSTEPVCTDTEYYDSTVYECVSTSVCGSDMIVDSSIFDASGKHVQCKCASGFQSVDVDCSTDSSGNCISEVCNACGSVAYSDNSACTTCGSGSTSQSASLFNSFDTGTDCVCDSYFDALVETDVVGGQVSGAKSCVTCPTGEAVVVQDQIIAGKQFYASVYKCQSCPDENMAMSVTPSLFASSSAPTYACTCGSGYIQLGIAKIGSQYCMASASSSSTTFQLSQNLNDWSKVTFDVGSGLVVNSAVMQHFLLPAIINCMFYSSSADIQACQALANLCVLFVYDVDSGPCSMFSSILRTTGRLTSVNGIATWGSHMPWLFYPSQSTDSICFDKSAVELAASLSSLQVKYVVKSYTLNGTYLGTDDLDTLLAYCEASAPHSSSGGGSASSTKWQIFGSTEFNTYTCNFDNLLNPSSGTVLEAHRFYELYLVDTSALFPVPVRIVNKQVWGDGIGTGSTTTVNQIHPSYLCDSSDEFVRRFYLYDAVSGIANDGGTSLGTPQAIRYAKNIILEVSIQTDAPTNIYAPILTIEYGDVSTASVTSSSTTSYTVSGVYSMDTSIFYNDAVIVMILCIIVAAVVMILRSYNWHMRTYRQVVIMAMQSSGININFETMYNLLLVGVNSFVWVFFPVTVVLCWYWFVFFKLQETVAVMLSPMYEYTKSTSPYYLFYLIIHAMFFAQLGYILAQIYKQINTDIFFIDWEPPSATGRPDEESSGSKKRQGPKSKVSVWRTILVANEWSELQTTRKTDISFCLFFLAFFMVGLDLQYNATPQPDLNDKSEGELNIILRFANTTFFWLAIAGAQYLWNFLIYERYISEPAEQLFIDFCTIAKISIFLMDERFHGYYLHCRSPHQYADCSMIELLDMLHQEESGLVVDRSLENAPNDVQSFEIFFSGEFKITFDKVYNNFLINSAAFFGSNAFGASQGGYSRVAGGTRGIQMVNMGSRQAAATPTGSSSDKVVKYWSEVMLFLQEWVGNNFNKNALRYLIREKTVYDRFLCTPPDLSLPDQPTIFYADRSLEYTKVLFLGIDADLLLLNILAYSLFDLWFNDTLTSILLTYLLECLLVYIREEYGKDVIARKTLVDSRFLI